MRTPIYYAATVGLGFLVGAAASRAGAVPEATTRLLDAKITTIAANSFELSADGRTLSVKDGKTTRYWKNFVRSERAKFGVGEDVSVRIREDGESRDLRELSDRATAAWLAKIRAEVMAARVTEVKERDLRVRFDDGREFSYRYTAKTKLSLDGAQLQPRLRVYIKGRTLSNLDVWAVSISARAPTPDPKPRTSIRKPSPSKVVTVRKLKQSGTMTGQVTMHLIHGAHFGLEVDDFVQRVHYTQQTRFRFEGRDVPASACQPGLRAKVSYRLDGFDRIQAQKVELFR